MIKQTKEEAAAYTPVRGNRTTKVSAALASLEVGEAVIIEKGKDWKSTKRGPFQTVNRFARKYNRQFDKERAQNGIDWWVMRTA